MANKLQTLQRKVDFDFLKKNGKRIYPCDWLIINYRPNEIQQLRCGWVVSKKTGNAVVRNKLKRWCREFFREVLKSSDSKPIDINVVFKVKNENFYKECKYNDFKENMRTAWKKIR